MEDLAVDSYFFTYFHDISAALEQIRDAIARTRPFVPEAQESPSAEQLIDTTVSRSNSSSRTGTSEHIQTYPEVSSRSSSSFRLSALLRPFQEIPLGRVVASPVQQDEHEEFTHVEKRDNTSFVPIALPPPPSDMSSTNQANDFSQSHTTRKPHTIPSSHTYPPFTSPGESLTQTTQEQSLATSWVSVPSWLRMSRRSLGGSSGASNHQSAEAAKAVTEVYSSGTHQSMASSQGTELGYSVLEAPDSAIDPEMIEKFQALFAFDDKEKLFGCSYSST